MSRRLFSFIFAVLITFSFTVSFAQAERRLFFRPSLRDPFAPPEGFEFMGRERKVLLEKVLKDVKIQGMVIKDDHKYVIINDQIVQEKSKWRDLIIDSIQPDHITVIYKGRTTKIPYGNK